MSWVPPNNPDYIPPPPPKRDSFSLVAVLLDLLVPHAAVLWAGCGLLGGFTLNRALLISLCYTLLRLKQIIIWIILIYRRYAPERIRAACLFHPTCSEYMLLAINKYGLLPGFVKGFGRLLRCRGSNKGEDFP